MICYQDDIWIGTTNENELKKKTDIILNRLRNAGMTNKKKIVNNCSKISFLVYTIPKEGRSPDQAFDRLQVIMAKKPVVKIFDP